MAQCLQTNPQQKRTGQSLPQLPGHLLDLVLAGALPEPQLVHLAGHLVHELLLALDLRLHPRLGRLLQLELALQLPDLELEPLVLHRAHILPLHVVQPGSSNVNIAVILQVFIHWRSS